MYVKRAVCDDRSPDGWEAQDEVPPPPPRARAPKNSTIPTKCMFLAAPHTTAEQCRTARCSLPDLFLPVVASSSCNNQKKLKMSVLYTLIYVTYFLPAVTA